MTSASRKGWLVAVVVLLVLLLRRSSWAYPPNPECDAVELSESDLRYYLFHRSNFSMDSRPVRNSRKPLRVQVGVRLFGIKDFIERENTLIIECFVKVKWPHEFLKWNNNFPYNCTDHFTLKLDDMWQPDLTFKTGSWQSNPSVAFASSASVANIASVFSDGSVMYDTLGELAVTCDLDLVAFPFDSQICSIIISSWQSPPDALEIFTKPSAFVRVDNLWTENQQWQIIANKSEVFTDIYAVTGNNYKSAVFRMLLRRKPLYYFVNVIVPSFIIGVVELGTFALPSHDVVKVHISFTCLLAYSVFQTMIISDLPKSSERVPMLTMYIELQMAYIGVIAILGEALVFAIVKKATPPEATPPPDWLLTWIIRPVGGFLFCSYRASPLPRINSIGSPLSRQLSKGSINKAAVERQWLYIAEVVERLIMWLYLLAISFTPLTMFLCLPLEKTLN